MWTSGNVLAQVDGINPRVAQWEKSTHPAQLRLYKYLDEITAALLPLPPPPLPLSLHLHVCVENSTALLRRYDLENFLTPLFGRRWLDGRRFHLVVGTKDTT